MRRMYCPASSVRLAASAAFSYARRMAIQYYCNEAAGHELVVSGGTSLFYPWHMHMRHWTLGLVRRGRSELTSPAGMRRMAAGGFFLVPPRIPHSLRIAERSEFLALCLDEKYALQDRRESLPALCTFLLPPEDALLGCAIEHLARQSRPLNGWHAGGALGRLAQRLVEQPGESLSVAEMAHITCASPWHFLRRFQSETGMTPHSFLLNCKIRQLRSLLRGRSTAADAAALAGFTDQSHMHKQFKLHHNLTPRQFMLAHRTIDRSRSENVV